MCKTYNQHALEASIIRALQHTPMNKLIIKYESEDLFQQSKTGRSGGPDGITDDLTRIAPEEMARIYRPITTKAQVATVEPTSRKRWMADIIREARREEDLHVRTTHDPIEQRHC